MESQSTNTKNKILECAKNEFLEKGFKNSSLRNISKSAGVTTGAIYGYFKDKDSIFMELVKDFMQGLKDLINEIEGEEMESSMAELFFSKESISDMVQVHNRYINYIYDNIDSAKLIMMYSDGSSAEKYIEELSEYIARLDKKRLEDVGFIDGVCIDEFVVHMLVKFYVTSVCELVEHDIKREDALKYITTLSTFFFSGWSEILKQ